VPTPSLAKTAGRISPRRFGPVPRCSWTRANSSAKGAASSRRAERGKSSHRGVEIPQELIRFNVVFERKSDQLLNDVVPLLTARVAVGHPSGHHVIGDPAETGRRP